MSKLDSRIAEGIETVLVVLQGLRDLLRGESVQIELKPEVAAQVEQRLKAGICLQANDNHERGKDGKRGCCRRHFGSTMRKIREGKRTERWYVERGFLTAEKKPAGRRPKNDSLVDEIVDEMSNAAVGDLKAAAKKADKSHPEKKKGAKKS